MEIKSDIIIWCFGYGNWWPWWRCALKIEHTPSKFKETKFSNDGQSADRGFEYNRKSGHPYSMEWVQHLSEQAVKGPTQGRFGRDGAISRFTEKVNL
jgi:hypothetical protein